MAGRMAAIAVHVGMVIWVASAGHSAPAPATGVCPPFQLRAGDGSPIDPVAGVNTDAPYSPRKTCGACHDYDLITQGYHFQQGKDEQPSERLTRLYHWVSTPGDYGGRW